jgi:hypothetical protein
VWGLWTLVQMGEVSSDPHTEGKRVRWWPDWNAFREAREGGHPAFDDPRFEPWELQALMRTIAGAVSENPYAWEKALRPRGRQG